MKSIFTNDGHQDIIKRLDKLSLGSKRQWGKMDVTQMLKHCSIPLEVALNKRELKTNANFFKKFLFKTFIKPQMYNDKLWKPNLQTPKQFVINDSLNFDNEKEYLLALINEFSSKREDKNWPTHPLFGDFTPEQRGKMQYKHLDHHLRQFDV